MPSMGVNFFRCELQMQGVKYLELTARPPAVAQLSHLSLSTCCIFVTPLLHSCNTVAQMSHPPCVAGAKAEKTGGAGGVTPEFHRQNDFAIRANFRRMENCQILLWKISGRVLEIFQNWKKTA
jgi:hypothetical protein